MDPHEIPPGGDSLPSQSVLVTSPHGDSLGYEPRGGYPPHTRHQVQDRGPVRTSGADGYISIASPVNAEAPRRNHRSASPKPFLRKGSRKEPSALNRGPSPRASPSGTPSPGKPQPFEPQPAHPQQRQQVQEKPVEAGQTRMLSVQRAAQGEPPSPPENEGGVRVSSHLIPLDESNYTDAVALKERMKVAQKEIDEFEFLEQQLLEASHISEVSLPLYSAPVAAMPPAGREGAGGGSVGAAEAVRSSRAGAGRGGYSSQGGEDHWHQDSDGSEEQDGRRRDADPAPLQFIDTSSKHGHGRFQTPEEQPGRTERAAETSESEDEQYVPRKQQPRHDQSSQYRSDSDSANIDDSEGEAEEETVSLRHLRKSWSGLCTGRGGERLSARVDDSRCWGDVTAPPQDAGDFEEEGLGEPDRSTPAGRRPHTTIRGYTSNRTSSQNQFAERTAPQATRTQRTRSPGGNRLGRGGDKSTPHTRSGRKSSGANENSNNSPDHNNGGSLRDLGAELQEELATYRRENAAVRTARKQQEAALADINSQKSKVQQWAEEERAKTQSWVDEQKAVIARERRGLQATKARMAAAGESSQPSRKERAEIQALHATIEKMKVDHEALRKKSKMNDQRLNQLVKDQNDIITDMTRKLDVLQADKDRYETWIKDSNLEEYYDSSSGGRAAAGRGHDKRKTKDRVEATGTIVSAVGRMEGQRAIPVNAKRSIANKSKTNTIRSSNDHTYAEEVFLVDELSQAVLNAAGGAEDESLVEDSRCEGSDSDNEEDYDKDWFERNEGIDSDAIASDRSHTLASTSGVTSTLGRLTDTRSNDDMVNLGTQTIHSMGLRSTANTTGVHDSEHEHTDVHNGLEGVIPKSTHSVRRSANVVHDVKASVAASSSQYDSCSRAPADSGQTVAGQQRPCDDSSPAAAAPTSGASSSGRVEVVDEDGTRVISYRNGTRKEVHLDGSLFIEFSNGDTKTQLPLSTSGQAATLLKEQLRMLSSLRELKSETSEALVGGDEYRLLGLQLGASVSFFGLEGNIVVYYYEKARTRHTSYPDGLEVYEFPNEQTEHHFPNGEKLITFTDGTTKAMFKNGMQESVFPDGVIVREYSDGSREVIE